MTRVTVELLPHGSEHHSRILGIAEITNDGQTSFLSDGQKGSYDVRLSKWAPKIDETWKTGRVENFSRQRRGPWDLLFLALREIVGDRNQ